MQGLIYRKISHIFPLLLLFLFWLRTPRIFSLASKYLLNMTPFHCSCSLGAQLYQMDGLFLHTIFSKNTKWWNEFRNSIAKEFGGLPWWRNDLQKTVQIHIPIHSSLLRTFGFSAISTYIWYLPSIFGTNALILRPLRSKDNWCWILRLGLWDFVIISERSAANLEKYDRSLYDNGSKILIYLFVFCSSNT